MSNESTLVIGPSGSGKTCYAWTHSRPLWFWDYDDKAENAPESLRQGNVKVTPLTDPPPLSALTMSAATFQRDAPAKMPTQEGEKPNAWRKTTELINEVYSNPEKFRESTIIIDSFSRLATYVMSELHYVKGSVGQPTTEPDYGILHDKWLQLFPAMVGMPCKHFILVAHEEIISQEATGKLFYSAYIPGKKFRPLIPTYFDNVYRCITITEADKIRYMIQTRAVDIFLHGKTKYHNLPIVCPADYSKLLELSKGEAPKS